MLMYLDHLQNWLDYGHSLLIFLILVLFWLSERGQISWRTHGGNGLKCRMYIITWFLTLLNCYYPRPVLAFGYCRCLRLCVRQSVCQSLACPRDNSGPVEAIITKFGPKVQNTLVKASIVLGANRLWPSRSNSTLKVKIYPILSLSAA